MDGRMIGYIKNEKILFIPAVVRTQIEKYWKLNELKK